MTKAPKPGTLAYAAAMIGVTLPTIYRLIASGELQTYHVGRAHRVTEESIRACIQLLEAKERLRRLVP